MGTIAERAKEFAQNFEIIGKDMDCGNCNTCRKCKDYRKYVDIVTEQREIDIEKACKWLKEQVYQEYGGGSLERLIPDTMIEEFRKAMEE